jgi:Tfp pilus assembly protein PilF
MTGFTLNISLKISASMSRIEKIKELMQERPADSFLKHALALEYIKLGNDDEAGALFISLLENDPGYIGSYYHLARLHERNERPGEAIRIYEKGMDQAKKADDMHAYNELRSAYEELTF